MDLSFTPAEIAFRDAARAFFRTAIPEPIRRKGLAGEPMDRQDIVTAQRILNARGWAVPHWPVEWGGQDWSPVQLYLYQDELQQAGVPQPLAFNTAMVGPVIATFGSAAQKRRFLARAANLDDWWCQGFSEPGAGSDLASLRTRAEWRGDAWVINGQKTWTTLAQHADWIFLLARTDPAAKPQQGISFILADMKTPGITVRPIQTIDGGHEVNEVFFDEVVVPAENLVGEVNKGWDYAKFLLGNERTGIARIGISKARLRRIRELAARELAGERPLLDDPDFRRRLALVEIGPEGAGADAAARGRRRAPAGGRQTRSGQFHPEDQGQRAAAGLHRTAAGRGRPLGAVHAHRRGRKQRAGGRAGLRRAGGAGLFQHAQGVDLRRHERDPAQHHRQGDSGILMPWTSTSATTSACCATASSG